MDIRFLGHACFELTEGDTTVLVDPFLTGNPKAAADGGRVGPTTSSSPTATPTTRRHRGHRQAHGRPGRGDRRAGGRDRRAGRRDVADPNIGGTVDVRLGLGQARAGLAHATTPKGTLHTPAGPGHRDRRQARLPPRRHGAVHRPAARRAPRDPVDVALVPIGGHYTMDRYDAVAAASSSAPTRSSPATTTRSRRSRRTPRRSRPTSSTRRRGGRRSCAGRDPHASVTHAIVLIEAERTALPTLGGALADVEGVAEAYSVTGEWDFVAVVRVREHDELRRRRSRAAWRSSRAIKRTHTMVAFEVFSAARPRGAVLDRQLSCARGRRRRSLPAAGGAELRRLGRRGVVAATPGDRRSAEDACLTATRRDASAGRATERCARRRSRAAPATRTRPPAGAGALTGRAARVRCAQVEVPAFLAIRLVARATRRRASSGPRRCAGGARSPVGARVDVGRRSTRRSATEATYRARGRRRRPAPRCVAARRARPELATPPGGRNFARLRRQAVQATRRRHEPSRRQRTERQDFQATSDPALLEAADRGEVEPPRLRELYPCGSASSGRPGPGLHPGPHRLARADPAGGALPAHVRPVVVLHRRAAGGGRARADDARGARRGDAASSSAPRSPTRPATSRSSTASTPR